MVTLKQVSEALNLAETITRNVGVVLSDIWFYIGVSSFGVSLLLWVISLRTIRLSIAYPTSSVSYIAVAVAATLFFGEQLTVGRVAGMILIILGTVLLYRGAISE